MSSQVTTSVPVSNLGRNLVLATTITLLAIPVLLGLALLLYVFRFLAGDLVLLAPGMALLCLAFTPPARRGRWVVLVALGSAWLVHLMAITLAPALPTSAIFGAGLLAGATGAVVAPLLVHGRRTR